MVISDYADEQSEMAGRRMVGCHLEPVISGYQDRDGEVVTFALTDRDTLLILDEYLKVGPHPIVYVSRAPNGMLMARIIGPDAPEATKVMAIFKNRR